MKGFKKLLVYSSLLAVVLSSMACGSKEESKKTKLVPGAGLNGQPANPGTVSNLDAAANQGLNLSISDIAKQSYGNKWVVVTRGQINNETMELGTEHDMQAGAYSATLQAAKAGYNIQVQGYCEDTNCNWYYLNMYIQQGNQLIYQIGYLRDFQFNNNLYVVYDGNSAVNFDTVVQELANSYNSMY